MRRSRHSSVLPPEKVQTIVSNTLLIEASYFESAADNLFLNNIGWSTQLLCPAFGNVM